MGEGAPERGVTRLPVKQAGLALPDPTKTAHENWTASCVITGHLVEALRGQEEFRAAEHFNFLQEVRTVVRKRSVLMSEEALVEALSGAAVQGAHLLQQETKKVAWMVMQPSTVNGTGLGAQEWRDALFLWYGLDPPDLPHYCDGCNATFPIYHALD